MSERRKPSTRYRGEPPPKRRLSTSPSPTKIRAVSPVVEPDEVIPSKLRGGQPLPTSTKPPDIVLPRRQFQDIRESGVLASSVERSRHQWLVEGIFERYWMKPSKKRSQEFANPSKESMIKLGSCLMIVEPHVFEVTLYSIKDSQVTFLPPLGQPQLPISGPAIPYQGSSAGTVGPVSQPTALPLNQMPYQSPSQHTGQSSQPSLPPFHEGFAQFVPQGPLSTPPVHSLTSTRVPSVAVPVRSPSLNGTTTTSTKDSNHNSDPVIQMLAARAATDHDLKSLMKVVAQGSASPDQLKIFQRHIDELKGIIEAQKDTSKAETTSVGKPSGAEIIPSIPVDSSSTEQAMSVQTDVSQTLNAYPSVGIKTEPLSQYYSQPPPYLKAKGPIPTRPDVCAIAFEFAAGTGDRYLLPKYSILEYLPGNTQVLMSFLVTRKGNAAASGKYKDTLEYYQPVTVRFSAQNARILEPLSRVVAPTDEVQRYMSDIMKKMTAAEEVYLVTQLPQTHEESTAEQEATSSDLASDVRMAVYPPPDSLLPIHSARKSSLA
ncbi:hypothetical protein MMC26_005312 [Xylographa opegraphella]|nr:hypothetical protein [Xylographa opegraphella]